MIADSHDFFTTPLPNGCGIEVQERTIKAENDIDYMQAAVRRPDGSITVTDWQKASPYHKPRPLPGSGE